MSSATSVLRISTFFLLLLGLVSTVTIAQTQSALKGQAAVRDQSPYFAGVYFDGVTQITSVGYHLKPRLAFTLTYQRHHKANRLAGTAGFPIGSPSLRPTEIFGQESIDYTELRDPHMFGLNVRYYIWGGFYAGGGFIAQPSYHREVGYETATRTIGTTSYPDLALRVRTTLKPRVTPVLSVGGHYVLPRFPVGIYLEAFFGVGPTASSKLKDATVITSTTLAAADVASLERIITNDSEQEAFGNFLFGVTYSF